MRAKKTRPLMLGGSAGGWSGGLRRLDDAREQITQRYKIVQRHRDPRTDHFIIDDPAVKKIGGGRSDLRQGESGMITMWVEIEPPVTQSFWDTVRINYRRLFRFAGHG